MRNTIEELIDKNPRHYSVLIKKDKDLYQWVLDNTLIQSENFIELLYSALHQETNICSNGNVRKISRLSQGWSGCGPAKICQCTRNNIADSVSITKNSISIEKKKESNKLRKDTLVSKYGYEYNSQRPEIKKILSKPKITEAVFSLLNNKTWLIEEYIVKERSLVDIADELGVYYGTVGEYCRKFNFKIRQRTNYSREEQRVCEFLDELGISYIRNDWDILGNKELDIYIPKFNLGIEINGLYWHSFNPNCTHTPKIEIRDRHISKTNLANINGVKLIQITDFEINNKTEIIKSIIRTNLGLSKRYYARKTTIAPVTKDVEKKFLIENHLQGYISSEIALGLYIDNSLLSIMTFGKSRFSKIADTELLRVATKKDCIIVGGFEKLFKYFLVTFSGKSIVSYCDRSKFSGDLYRKIGFTSESKIQPGYFWTQGNYPISRQRCQKRNLSKWLINYDKDKSESDNLFSQGYRRYWDCGQQTWIFRQ